MPEPGARIGHRYWWADPHRHEYRAADRYRPEWGCASCGHLAASHPDKLPPCPGGLEINGVRCGCGGREPSHHRVYPLDEVATEPDAAREPYCSCSHPETRCESCPTYPVPAAEPPGETDELRDAIIYVVHQRGCIADGCRGLCEVDADAVLSLPAVRALLDDAARVQRVRDVLRYVEEKRDRYDDNPDADEFDRGRAWAYDITAGRLERALDGDGGRR